jgi:hypothetical protein
MVDRDLVDHSKSSWESLLPVAGIAGFLFFERADVRSEPPAGEHFAHSWQSLAALGCAAATWYGLRKHAPALGASLGSLMAGYELFLKRYPRTSRTIAGLSWEEMEQATPDLHAAKRAAQVALHGVTSMPGIMQMGYHLERAIDPMTKEDVP